MNISELNLSVRSHNLLHRKGIETVEALLSMSDYEITNLYNGERPMAEIIEVVRNLREGGAEQLNNNQNK